MASREIERGPVADRVSRQLAAMRTEQAMTLGHLSERLTKLGRPISVSGLSKVERGERRVDVDDLVSLAIALNVSPARLLLPGRPTDGTTPPKVELTPSIRAAWQQAWLWATGARPLSAVDLHGHWKAQNRPHEEPLQADDFEAMAKAIDAGVAALERAKAAGFATDNNSLATLFVRGGLPTAHPQEAHRG